MGRSRVELERLRDEHFDGGVDPASHLILLPLQSLHVVELLRLQLAHPVVQLSDLIPAEQKNRQKKCV